jgi:hypothetical protein
VITKKIIMRKYAIMKKMFSVWSVLGLYSIARARSTTPLARTSTVSKLQTRPLIREGTTKQQTCKCLKKMSRRKKNWSWVPDGT